MDAYHHATPEQGAVHRGKRDAAHCEKRRAAHCKGWDAETLVAEAWRDQGFSVLARRLRTGAGEIDLVVADARNLVFIEVKARGSFHEAAYAVAPRQQTRLTQAAEAALAAHEDWQRNATRFDVALVCNGKISHIADAIRAN